MLKKRRQFSSQELVSHSLSSFPCLAQFGFLEPSPLALVTLQYITMSCLNRGQRETGPPPEKPGGQLWAVTSLQYITMTVSCVPRHSTSPTHVEGRWALGIQEQEPLEGAVGGGFWGCPVSCPCTGAPERHRAWGRGTGRVTWGHTVSSPGDMDYREVKVK